MNYGKYNGHMSNKKKTKDPFRPVNRWSEFERQAFADHLILRAQTIPNKKRVASKKACRGRANWD